ncbi:hypothetical protein B0H14DRAFT_3514913 [Mycena olivaceomarginata]|nr:hypothetical protein B0H14DRAFT_3514913 [Mycena olivaceomarginata]
MDGWMDEYVVSSLATHHPPVCCLEEPNRRARCRAAARGGCTSSNTVCVVGKRIGIALLSRRRFKRARLHALEEGVGGVRELRGYGASLSAVHRPLQVPPALFFVGVMPVGVGVVGVIANDDERPFAMTQA